MHTGRTDELTRHFGAETADAISVAYEEAISASTDGGMIGLTTDQRLRLVQALIDEVQGKPCSPDHLKQVALVLVAKELRDVGSG